MALPLLARQLVMPLLLLAAWQLAIMDAKALQRAPSPARVAAKAWEMLLTGELPLAIWESLHRVAFGFGGATVLALGIGLLMGASRAAGRNLDPLIETFRPIAPIALLPLAILWFGTGTPAAAFIVGYAAFFPMLVNTVHGVRTADRRLVEAARTLGVGPATIVRTVLVPAALPSLFVGARLALGVAWTSIIAAELAVGAKAGGGATGGIGQMMFVALVIDRGFRILQRSMMPWRP